MADYKRTGSAAEFNPRASPPCSTAADHNSRWAPLNSGAAHFSTDHPLQPDPSSHAAPPTWWVSPSRSFTPSSVYGGARPLPNSQLEPLDHSRSLHDTGVAPGRFATDLNRNNPYLDPAIRSPSASWRQMQQQQVHPACSGAEDWNCNGRFPSCPAATSYAQPARTSVCDQDRADEHPVFPDQHPPPGFPVAQAPTRSSCSFPQLASANRPPVRPSNGDGNFKVGNEAHYGWINADHQGVRNVGRSQSMRALFEENAALRRALISMRRGPLFGVQGTEQVILDGEQDRYIVSDIAEGRALSMREPGRWAMTHAAAAAGEVVGGNGGANCSMWAGTPRQPWANKSAAGQPLHGGGSMHGHHRAAYYPSLGWEDAAAEHPSFSYGGGSFGGWPEDFIIGSRSDHYTHWADDVQNDHRCQGTTASGNGLSPGEGTSLKQLLVKSDRGGMINGHKCMRQGKKKLAPPNCEQVEGKHAAMEEEGTQCAMCGGKLGLVQGVTSRKKGSGLPLRLCVACHPRTAASLPQSTMRSPPVTTTTAQVRQHVGTAIFMACRPNAQGDQEMKQPTKRVKPAKKRIMELCRQFVGLATGKPSDP